MKKSSLLPALLLAASTAPAFAQYSATLPLAGQFLVTPSFYYQSSNNFYVGDSKKDLSDVTGKDSLDQYSYFLSLEYALSERLALDGSIGYSESGLDGGPKDSGFTDSRIGLRYNLAITSTVQGASGVPAPRFPASG